MKPIPVAARYVSVEKKVSITLKNGKVVSGPVRSIVKEHGAPTHEGRIHIRLDGYPLPFAVSPNQTIHIL